jgi:hypothetical protein
MKKPGNPEGLPSFSKIGEEKGATPISKIAGAGPTGAPNLP